MRMFTTIVLTVSLASGFAACQKKSSKKGGSATPTSTTPTDPKPTPQPPNSTTVVPNTTPPIGGLTCTSTGLLNKSESKTIVIDTANNRMQITQSTTGGTGTSGTQDYTLQKASSMILAPKSPRYEVIPASGQSGVTGHIVITNLDEATPKVYLTGVPFSFGDGKTLNAIMSCHK